MMRFITLAAACFGLAASQQCMPVTDMPCQSSWSDYTTCPTPDESMTEGIASYKQQVAQMGCEVPPWYWQATVESQMMSARAGLMQYRQSHHLGPMETVVRLPKMTRRKRDVDYEDDSNYIYQEMNTNQVSAGCGFCARRIRCCKDFYQSWIDQNIQSDVCEEYSDACQVPPMDDGSCDYALAMPKLMNNQMDQVPGNNSVIEGRLQNRLQDKWMSLLGATEPTMYCTKNGNVCNCCCGNYTAEPTEHGAMVCRRRRGPSGCGPNEVYEDCSTSCQPTCMEPNPTSCAEDQCKTIYAGCKCKAGMVRYGVNCIAADQCPPNSGGNQSIAMSVQSAAGSRVVNTLAAGSAVDEGPIANGGSTSGGGGMTTTTTTTTTTTYMQSGSATTIAGSGAGGMSGTSSESFTTTSNPNCMLSWSIPSPCTTVCNYQVTITAPDPNNSTSILLDLTAAGPTGGSDFWTGIGWSPSGLMTGSDATLILVTSGVVTVQDWSLGNHMLNALDSNQNAFLVSGSMNNGVLTAKVRIMCKQDDDSLNVCTSQFYPLYPAVPSPLQSGQPQFHTTTPQVGAQHSFATCF